MVFKHEYLDSNDYLAGQALGHYAGSHDSLLLGKDLIRYGRCMNQASASTDCDLVHGLFRLCNIGYGVRVLLEACLVFDCWSSSEYWQRCMDKHNLYPGRIEQ